ncbi:hypothetical protein PR202_gb28768 [Eleusine coracana subsp. coracana]|uniref:MATH domain-containing protein n=1 Tax=Eleusine coracana subsp. coracana TaxID=191504 RepID=A0AAV5FY39_ELECO|nr:hypothetical protein QOZ80_8BG0645380 [Eleusine coracana subsp. coracana]GJN39637.1 hypothetical protein PR202_gb28768 [Eleusine coracana subsp. coracana]
MSSMPPLLTPAGVQSATEAEPSRAASAVAAKPARGFQVFHIDGYSWTTTLPAGERVTSDPFVVGGRTWQIDYYPNGADASAPTPPPPPPSPSTSGSSPPWATTAGTATPGPRTVSGPNSNSACSTSLAPRPTTSPPRRPSSNPRIHAVQVPIQPPPPPPPAAADLGCGNAEFITKEELERRGQSLLADDCLAILCDVGVVELEVVAVVGVGHKRKGLDDVRDRGGLRGGRHGSHGYHRSSSYDDSDDGEEDDGEGGGRRHKVQDEKEFVRPCLTRRRRMHLNPLVDEQPSK